MEVEGINSMVRVRQCNVCLNDMEFHCLTCEQNLCLPCKMIHNMNLHTRGHKVLLYRNKCNPRLKHEICEKHPDQVYDMFCEYCNYPVCPHCEEHSEHTLNGISKAYQNKYKQQEENIIKIRSDMLFKAMCIGFALLSVIQRDIRNIKKELKNVMSTMMKTSQEMKKTLDSLPDQVHMPCKNRYFQLLRKQKLQMKKHLAKLQIYEEGHEQSANRPVKFLRFAKKHFTSHIEAIPILEEQIMYSLIEGFNMKILVQIMSRIQIKERGGRKAENELLLQSMPFPVLQKYINVTDIDQCGHISCVSSNRVWVSNFQKKLGLADATGSILQYVEEAHDPINMNYSSYGFHSVNSQGDLFYISMYGTVNKLSNDRKESTIFFEPNSKMVLKCLYSCQSSGDVLLGIFFKYTELVMRVDSFGDPKQLIQVDNNTVNLFRSIYFITENNNGDVVVSNYHCKDYGEIVVTDCEGNHRFSYRGPPSDPKLLPKGVCTDALSHILLCDSHTHTVQILNKNGTFLSYLLTNQSLGVHNPTCLCYDTNLHLLVVGSGSFKLSRLSIYSYIHVDRNLAPFENAYTVKDKVNSKPCVQTEKENTKQPENVTVIYTRESMDVFPNGEPLQQYAVGYSQDEYDMFEEVFKARKEAKEATIIADNAEEEADKIAQTAKKTVKKVKSMADIYVVTKLSKDAMISNANTAARLAREAAEKTAAEAKVAKTAANAAAEAETKLEANQAAIAAKEARKRAEKAAEMLEEYRFLNIF